MMVTITSLKKIQDPDLLQDTSRKCLTPPPTQKHKERWKHRGKVSPSSTSSSSTVIVEIDNDNSTNERLSSFKEEEEDLNSTTSRNTPKKLKSSFTNNSPTNKWCDLSLSCSKLALLVISVIIIISLLLATLLFFSGRENMVSSSSSIINDSDNDNPLIDEDTIYEDKDTYEDNYEDSEEQRPDLKEVSKLSWNLLNSNQDKKSSKDRDETSTNQGQRWRHGGHGHGHGHGHRPQPHPHDPLSLPLPLPPLGDDEVVLPSKMIFTTNDTNTNEKVNKKRSCCRTQKYAQVIKRPGCEEVTITNKMCFGQCVSVWVPGLFASFPVCKPSRSTFRTVTLTCENGRKRRVKIEKVKRCSCMEIDPSQQQAKR